MPKISARPPEVKLSLRKKLAFSVVVQLVALVGLELAARVGSYFYYGRNPYYLYYGFRSWTNDEGVGHSVKHDGYFKFPPNQIIEYGTPEPAHINNHGYRGADFEIARADGAPRVVCMGASSTFGYLNRDQGTYPFLLEQRLREQLSDERVEVINAAIPHFDTNHLVAVLRSELLALEPDVFTLYTACNDAVYPIAERTSQRVSRWLDEYSAAFAGLRKVVNAASGPVVFGRWAGYLPRMSRAELERQLVLHQKRTRANLEAIASEVRASGAQLVLIRQPITTWIDQVERGLAERSDPRPSYEQEFADIEHELAETGFLHGFQVPLYVHHHLLGIIDEIAAANGLPVVDNVALIAEHPEGLGSKVHLTEEANARLADALAPVIAPLLAADR